MVSSKESKFSVLLVEEVIVKYQSVLIKQGDRTVLADVSFQLAKGSFTYLIGKTGGGKSSLLKTIYGDLAIEDGHAEVVGTSLRPLDRSKVPALRRKLGIVFQDFQLLFDRSVFENLSFVMRATGWTDKAKMKHRAQEVLLQVGLPNATHKMPHQLSGGEQQRVVIARALLNQPSLLIADEPTGNLDPEVSLEIMKIFKQINASGTTVLMATHSYYLLSEFPGDVLRCQNETVSSISIEDLRLQSQQKSSWLSNG